jgi:hypothetical protein
VCIYLCTVVYITMLPAPQATYGRVSVNNELQRIRKEALWSDLRYYPGHCLEGLGKTTNTKDSQDSRCRGRDSSRRPPEYKARALPLEPTCSVKDMWVRAS